MPRCYHCAGMEAKVSQCEEELKAAKKAARQSNATIEGILRSLKDALQSGNASESPAVLYNVLGDLQEGLYERKCEEALGKRRAPADQIALCDVGHEFVEILINQDFSQERTYQRYSKAAKVISQIMEKEKRLIQQGLLDAKGIRTSQKHYCWILRQLASIEKHSNAKAAEDKLREVEAVHRSIWMRREEAKGLKNNDEWVLENGHQLGLVLAELKKADEGHYRLAEMQLRDVWETRMKSPEFGPTHDATVDSALQLVSMLEKQKMLDGKRKSAAIGKILGAMWCVRSPRVTAGRLKCGLKLGDHLHQQKRYPDTETVLTQVWTTRKDALGQPSNEADEARSAGYILASALYCQNTREKHKSAKVILKKLWAERRFYWSTAASPSNDSIAWMLAWTYRELQEHAQAESMFQSIWETRKNDLGPQHPKTLAALYELGQAQVLQKHWAEAKNKFQQIWNTRKDGTEGQLEREDTIARLRAGHQLGVCLLEQKSYVRAIKVLEQVHSGRVWVLDENAMDTKRTKMALEGAKKALMAQTEAKKANAKKVPLAFRMQSHPRGRAGGASFM